MASCGGGSGVVKRSMRRLSVASASAATATGGRNCGVVIGSGRRAAAALQRETSMPLHTPRSRGHRWTEALASATSHAPWLVPRGVSQHRPAPKSLHTRCGDGRRWLSTRPESMGALAGEAGMRPSRNMQRSRDLDDLFDAATVFYKLRIITGDLRGAGTTEEVFIELHGDNGSSGRKVMGILVCLVCVCVCVCE
jgi:hypothetical protein